MPRAVRTKDAPAGDPRVFKALADANRRRILRVLGAGEMRASDVAAAFDISRPAVSRHLRILAEAGLLSVRKSGRERRYRIRPARLREAAALLRELDARWQEGLRRLGEALSRREPGP